ncbi:MAG: TetR/AcrR family transcriptional regulator [Bacteriovoracaceae bacterium]
MTNQTVDTKEKILEVARVLFADKGFDGTSVRDIAKAAEVNVASVNYHFDSKENLFHEILLKGHSEVALGIKDFYETKNPNLEELIVYVFRYFLERSPDLISIFKMMMSSQNPKDLISKGTEDETFGPPGGKVIADCIIKEVGRVVKEEDLHWGVKALFSHVVHLTIISSCCIRDNSLPYSSPADIEKGIRRLSKIVIQELRTSSM